MKHPRFSIASIMAIIVITSINLAAIRALDWLDSIIGAELIIGALPMASILAWGLPTLTTALAAHRHPGHFLIGFQASGWSILFLYATAAALFPIPVVGLFEAMAYFLLTVLGLEPSVKTGPGWPFILCCILIVLLPQLALAYTGGWFHQTFKIVKRH